MSEWAYGTVPSGAFAIHVGAPHYTGTHVQISNASAGYDFDASRCSDRYGNFTEVNPLYEGTLLILKY